jgi:hypothetical protein
MRRRLESVGFSLLVSSCFFLAPRLAAADTTSEGASAEAPVEEAPVEQAPTETAPRGVKTKTRWYGWQMVIIEGGALAAGVGLESWQVALGGYALGPAVVHWAHGNVAKGFASIGLRVGMPLATGFTTAMFAAVTTGDLGTIAIAASGATVLGAAGAIMIDTVFLAREPVSTVQPERSAPSEAKAVQRISPTAAVTPNGATVGVVGVF